MNKNPYIQLITNCVTELSKCNIKILFTNKQYVLCDDGTSSLGYWDDQSSSGPVLACSTSRGPDIWVPIFAHEFCHFCQWRERSDIWHNAQRVKNEDLELILHNKPITKHKLEFCLNTLRDLEADCEKRTVKLLCKYKIPISISDYIKQANSYIYFYNQIKVHRAWYKKNEMPYVDTKIVKLCPDKFKRSYNITPPVIAAQLEKQYPSKKVNNIL